MANTQPTDVRGTADTLNTEGSESKELEDQQVGLYLLKILSHWFYLLAALGVRKVCSPLIVLLYRYRSVDFDFDLCLWDCRGP